jgi:hypothetical protein
MQVNKTKKVKEKTMKKQKMAMTRLLRSKKRMMILRLRRAFATSP